jgi:AraC-like DNA-binding protein/ligand-binding sensor protein
MVARNDLTESPPPDVPNVRAAMVRCLQQSELFREYREAFEATTGLPLVLRAAGAFQAPLEGSKHANPFCALMIQSNKTCATCLQLQQRAEKEAVLEAKTLQCYAGLSESLVPVRVGHLVLAYLQTGQVFLRAPSKRRFKTISAAIPGGASDGLKAAYFRTRVMPRKQYQAIIRLLVVFAEHLATVSNQLLTSRTTTEPPVITKVRTFIALHQDEALSLNDAAHAVNMSPFYFCKVFKKSTGLTFTEYLARARIETVKHMLLDAHMRVSEAAYASGFQSLSQFNRVFLRVAGEAPRSYRDRLHEANTRP